MSNELASNARVTDEELIAALRFLAVDCEYTDGWEAAAPSLILAADRLSALKAARAPHEPAPETINGRTYGDIIEPYRSALRMIRDAIQELFGPIASLESEEAELLRGPEPHHTAEAYIAALQRVKAALPIPAKDGPEVVAYMHPTAKWAHHRVTEVLPHCKTDGSDGGPQPLVRQSACQQEVERLRAASIASGNALYDARVRNAELVKALEWYGEQARLARLIHSEGDSGRHALAEDGGKRARDAIRAKTQEVSS